MLVKCVPKRPIDNKPSSILLMACRHNYTMSYTVSVVYVNALASSFGAELASEVG